MAKVSPLLCQNLYLRWNYLISCRTPATTNLSNETKNTFSNDGSFLEQFKKMQQKSGIEDSSKASSSNKNEYFDRSKSKQSSLSLGYTISSSSDSHKSILTSPPPPPPSQLDSKDTTSQGTWTTLIKYFSLMVKEVILI